MGDTPCLAVYDITGIQEFIFSSNKVKENIGASIYVQKIFEEGLLSCIEEEIGETKCKKGWKEETDFCFFDEKKLDAEIIYIGGGNAMILFRSKDKAKAVTKKISKKILEETQGTLGVVVACIETDLSNFKKDKEKIFRLLNKNKNRPSLSTPLRGIAITRVCSDGLSSSGKQDKSNGEQAESNQFISDAADTKRQATTHDKENFENLLPDNHPDELNFPAEFDDLGGTEGESHIAVIHIDGNSMGRFIDTALTDKENYKDAVPTIRSLSKKIQEVYEEVFKEMVTDCFGSIKNGTLGTISLKPNTLPIRPLILSGDDVTFVCDARIGIQLAVSFLKNLSKKTIGEESYQPSACAGIAIVKSHFPFHRAYHLAESLCGSAKKKAKSFDQKIPGCWMDYHIVYSGFQTDLEAMRKEQYNIPGMSPVIKEREEKSEEKFPQYNLLLRPFCVVAGGVEPEPRYKWDNMESLFINMKENIPRSRLKKLRNKFIVSENDVKICVDENSSREYNMPKYEWKSEQYCDNKLVFQEEQTPYFEPLELLDYYTPELDTPSGSKTS